jgi:hypothetical protein
MDIAQGRLGSKMGGSAVAYDPYECKRNGRPQTPVPFKIC